MDALVGPIVKWAGGKRQLLPEILPLIDRDCTTYVEPFLGGGAVLFQLQPEKAIINDYNGELMNVYRVVRDCPEALIQRLEEHRAASCADYFYQIRAMDREADYARMSPVERAARVIYLNKTCYNGLYRVNGAGQFNAPYGRYKSPRIVNAPVIRAMSRYLGKKGIKMMQGDYREALKGLRRGAFVYLDPPYMPLSSSASFTGYTDSGFDYDQQVALKRECDKLRARNIPFLQSNSDCPAIRDLYQDYEIRTVRAKRTINSDKAKRGEINEVLIRYVPDKG
ncbi:DNA adenine methylase [Pseudoflavonifractor sp. 524-17]|uniref:DNA adenine methylase n=1 Tax=Pseudoflavonifractor sp. 524-17 TaxID=2304577 RepID=UPI00137AF466|nr:DNA adenine methylase [Pseudoflavonifractor sp. 524-17]NCE63490.1 DNA adenine methylase [Pseudoflavonifractor sp. 524-17]